MNEIINALIFGVIQGLTEFLPVSSSGHLELAKYLFGDDSMPAESLLMSVVLHAATALSTIVVFRKDIIEIIKHCFSKEWNNEKKFALNIVISMIPAAIIGIVFEEQLEQFFDQRIMLVGVMLLVTAGLLLMADRAKNTDKNVKPTSAIVIGLAQAIAILPGISRSGATISTAVLLGIDKEKAARFSFLMVVPLILGKMAKDLLDGDVSMQTSNGMELIIGFVAAFFTGIVACTWMIKLVKQSKLSYFAFYCLIVGIIAIACGWMI